MKEIKKVQKEIENLQWKLRNDVVDDADKPEIQQKIEDLKKVIEHMLESLPGLKQVKPPTGNLPPVAD